MEHGEPPSDVSSLNSLEELDAPGEWYLDRTGKQLYYYPNQENPSHEPQSAQMVLATLNQPVLKITGAKHVVFEGLAFEYAHSDGIALHGTEHVQLVGCVIANLAGGGVSVDGSHNTVRSCDLYNLGRQGISLNGGDRKSLTLAGNLAVNNHIHHYGLFQRTYAPGSESAAAVKSYVTTAFTTHHTTRCCMAAMNTCLN
ncbi:MAG: right-handed parallel beta-helix repeat-containing protein [Pirellulaceae bacterium]